MGRRRAALERSRRGRLPAEAVRTWVRAGAALVGGCCGLGPDAVRGVAAAVGTAED